MWKHTLRAMGWSALALAAAACDDEPASTPSPTPDMGATCPVGTADCPCADDDTCADGLSCAEGVCRAEDTPDPDMGPVTDMGPTPVGGCTAGTLGCACAEGACGEGLACEADLCVEAEAPTTGLRVEGLGAKGCEALLRATGAAKAVDVGFVDGVKGQFARRGDSVAIAFVSAMGADLMFVGGVRLDTGATATAAELSVVNTTCFDLAGRPVPGAAVVLD